MPVTYATPDLYPCDHCGRRFSRREHLERHKRIHTREKPFTCTVCGKSYARRDVFVRHLQLHNDPEPAGLPPAKRRNVRMACDSCHDRKVKCTPADIPCERCKRGGTPCTFLRASTLQDTTTILLPSEVATDTAHDNNTTGQSSHSEPMSSLPDELATHSPCNIVEVDDLSTDISNAIPMNATSSYPEDLPVFSDGNFLALDPFLMAFDDPSSQLLPQVSGNIYEEFAAACGYPSADYDVSSWMGVTDSPSLILNSLNSPSVADRSNNNDQARLSTFSHAVGAQRQRRVAIAYDMLRQYSTADQPSRPSSPKSVQAHNKYLQELGHPAAVACDSVILNIFIGLFSVYVAPTLPCFRDQVVDSSTPEEVSLTMAAIGGLFCEAAKSASIARWLFHAAQRKLNTLLYCETPHSPRQRWTIINCYILMDVFAYLYGDKRILLLYEVYHGQVIQTFIALNGERDDEGQDDLQGAPQKKLIADTVYLLECYRVVILQLPSRLYPTTLFGGVGTDQQHTEDARQSLIRAITTYDLPQLRITTPEDSMQSLCSVALLASRGRQLPGSLMALLKSPISVSDPHYSILGGLQLEYIELALQKWRTLHTTPLTASVQSLFHLIHLSLYCNYAEIEGVARVSQKTKEKEKERTTQNGSPPIPRTNVMCSDSERKIILQKCFHNPENLNKAGWHANQLLNMAVDIELVSLLRSNNGQIHLRQEARRNQNGEPVHFAHAVYHATMVLRLSSILQNTGESDQSIRVSQGELESITSRGIRILSRSAGRVAGVFRQVLESLQTTS